MLLVRRRPLSPLPRLGFVLGSRGILKHWLKQESIWEHMLLIEGPDTVSAGNRCQEELVVSKESVRAQVSIIG